MAPGTNADVELLAAGAGEHVTFFAMVSTETEVLDYSGRNRLGADGWHALAAMQLPKLHTLYVASTYARDGAGIAALACATGFPSLRKLYVAGEILLHEEDLLPLARYSLALEDLAVCDMPIGDGWVEALLANPRAARLRALSLNGTRVTQAGAKRLASLANLEEVGLTRTYAIPYNEWTDWNGAIVGGADDMKAWEDVHRLLPRVKIR